MAKGGRTTLVRMASTARIRHGTTRTTRTIGRHRFLSHSGTKSSSDSRSSERHHFRRERSGWWKRPELVVYARGAKSKGFGAMMQKKKSKEETCPCGQGEELPYSRCCKPYHKGLKQVDTPRKLLETRFSAYAKGLSRYLIDSHAMPQVRVVKCSDNLRSSSDMLHAHPSSHLLTHSLTDFAFYSPNQKK